MLIVPTILQTKKGKVFGIFFKAKENKDIPLILTHGSGDNHNQYPLPHIARMLTKKGYATFRFDFRGCGNSDGKQENYSISSQMYDLNEVIDFVKDKLRAKEVGIISKSISSVPAFIVASKRKDIKFLITLGAPYNLEKYWTKEEVEAAKKFGYVFFKGFKYGYKYAKEMFEFKRVYKNSLRGIKIPVLLLIGEKDEKVSLEEEKEIFHLLGTSNKNLEIIKNGNHSFKLSEKNLEHLTKSILAFVAKMEKTL
jgi:hypothetical protein